ncbi:hypothetical protein SAMN07250955_104205 [Arboricoccus pini]|uniref:YcjX family protein n=1 Tax=Arboricoccus pini TaxID=1963835 RepID=A0A212R021_9PROT|nr:YcjX family protein [Arboricoccus pini]SNB65157.1 hypothetical protein SAMN07250955_104205 [Arboricoccus pini]
MPPLFSWDLGLGRLVGGLADDIAELSGRALDNHLNLAVTGLRRSGKTVFITSLVHHLIDGHNLPFVAAVHEDRYMGAREIPLHDTRVFPYRQFHHDLDQTEPNWPAATETLSRLRLLIRARNPNRLTSTIQPIRELTLDIIDYPGEWLLDLPLIDETFQSFSEAAFSLAQTPPRTGVAQEWLAMARSIDQSSPVDTEVVARLSAAFTTYLKTCQRELGLSVIQPGRFTNPGEHAGSELLHFTPLPAAAEVPGSIRALFRRRFDLYRDEIVKRFYQDHFRRFDRQIVLVDLLSNLNAGAAYFADTQLALSMILKSFRYGSSSWLGRLFRPRIGRALFAASKADHVAPSQHAALKQLLELMIRPAARSARLEGVRPEVIALASLRCTDVVKTTHQGQTLSCLKGRRLGDKEEKIFFPGEIPPELPEAEDWTEDRFRFYQFEPRRLRTHGDNQHIRLDQAIEFLIGDKL